MGIVYFGSLIFNAVFILLPISALTAYLLIDAAKVQKEDFRKFLPYTIVLAFCIAAAMLGVLALRLPPRGVYALQPFSVVTQRPALGLLVLAAIAAYIGAGLLPERMRAMARHAAIALCLSAMVQCAAVIFATSWLYGLLGVQLYY